MVTFDNLLHKPVFDVLVWPRIFLGRGTMNFFMHPQLMIYLIGPQRNLFCVANSLIVNFLFLILVPS